MSPCDPNKSQQGRSEGQKTIFTTIGWVQSSRLATPEVLQDLTGLYQKYQQLFYNCSVDLKAITCQLFIDKYFVANWGGKNLLQGAFNYFE